MTNSAPERLLRRHEVQRLVGLGRSAIYDAIARGTFPRPVKIGARAVAWRQSDLRRWMDDLPAATDAEN